MARDYTTAVDDTRRIGSVTANRVTVERIEVTIDPIEDDPNVTEYHLVVNGRVVLRMHPHRAKMLGIIDREGY